MFRAILYTQWKWSRWSLLASGAGAALLPMLSARSDFTGGTALLPLLGRLESFGILYPIVAFASGILVAIATWLADRQGRHVYGLVLPLTRWHFVLLRYAGGALLLLVPVVMLLIAAVLASLTSTLPPGIHAYPLQLAARFLLASLVAYTFAFPLAASDRSTVGILVGGLVLLLLLYGVGSMLGLGESPIGVFLEALFTAPGPFGVFSGRWMLFDV